jgi:hypothetical protein
VPLPAQPKPQPSPPPVGTTREQVLERFGEPKNQLKAGPREILFFPRLKVTLRYNVVVETEELADEAPPQRPVEPPTTATKSGEATAASSSAEPRPAAAPEGSASAKPADAAAPPASPPKPVREAEPGLAIRIVRRPPAGAKSAPAQPVRTADAAPSANAGAVRPSQTEAPAVASSAVTTATRSTLATATTAPAPKSSSEPASGQRTATTEPGATNAKADASASVARADPNPTVEPAVTEGAKTVVVPQRAPPKAASRPFFRRRRADATEPAVQLFSTQTYVLTLVMAGCVAYLFWLRRQRRMELAATTVSSTPFNAPVADTGAMFTAAMIGQLDAGRFEKLVASYYTKTGVVAESANGGPNAPIHIKIFWKGEPKPFAGVQCHARPSGLIAAQPLQALSAALNAAEIRRGYVVTTGKFTVEARDVAEEKHFTLRTGDLLLEKLNALPPAARNDLLKETTAEPTASVERGGA